MKVLYVSKAMAVGAYRDKLRELARHVELHAVAPDRWGGRPADRVTPDQPWMRLTRATLAGHNHFHLYSRPRDIFDGFTPDVVHIDEEPYSAVTAQLARACVRRGLPFVFFAWQNIEKRVPPPFGRVRAYVFRHAAGGIAGTDAAARVLRLWRWQGPLEVIPQMGVAPERFRPDVEARAAVRAQLGIGPSDFLVGFVGRLVREKGVHVLVRAVAELPDVHVCLLGDGPERPALESAIRQAGMAARVHIQGQLPCDRMPRWLPAFDVVVLPSLTTPGWMEQFGRAIVEAMACGVPVIGSDSGEIPHVIGPAGRVVPEGDAAALAAALREFADSPELRCQLSGVARARVLENFTNAHIARATHDFYQRVLNGAAS